MTASFAWRGLSPLGSLQTSTVGFEFVCGDPREPRPAGALALHARAVCPATGLRPAAPPLCPRKAPAVLGSPPRRHATVEHHRSIGKDAIADQFVTSMNRAAERAVPETASVFAGAISQMSIEDARGILNGGDRAATEFGPR